MMMICVYSYLNEELVCLDRMLTVESVADAVLDVKLVKNPIGILKIV